MERAWKLGDDLHPLDNLLDPVTFDELIITLHCNLPSAAITPATVRRQLKEILDCRKQDMEELLERNMEIIIRTAKGGAN